jgi:hypothetical protein
MKKRSYSTFFFIFFIVLCFLGILLFLIKNRNTQKETLENNINLQIVIARYNEDLEWLKEEPFNQYPVIVYNKGPNTDFYHAPNITQIIPVKNIGRDAHTILYHIIEKYDNLADVTVFLPGSSQMEHKIPKAKSQVTECAKHNNTVIIKNNSSTSYHPNGIQKDLNDFQIDDYASTDTKNKDLNPENKLLPAEIRPFGKWHATRFPNIQTNYVSYNCIIGISKKHILQHPKSYYENLIRELSTHSSPEVVHYYERSWFSIFTPNNDAVIV